MMWNHSRPACHRASPLWIYPLRDSHNEQQLSLKLDVNTSDGDHLSAHYLCLTITLESPQNGKRVLTLAPYNKRHLFNFVFPMLTQWNSYTTTAIKHGAMKSMVQYAIIGSNDPDRTVKFLCDLVDRLRLNGYPRRTVLRMWETVVASDLYSIPCRVYLHNNLPTVASRVTIHINTT